MSEPTGYRTPWIPVPQPNVTFHYEDGVTYHEIAGRKHYERFERLPDGYTWNGQSLDGMWACTGCGFVVEPIFETEQVPDEQYMKLLEIVKALAEGGPYIDNEWDDCVLCSGERIPTRRQVPAHIEHRPTCPWRMAIEVLK